MPGRVCNLFRMAVMVQGIAALAVVLKQILNITAK
jgi:hypothetical protein